VNRALLATPLMALMLAACGLLPLRRTAPGMPGVIFQRGFASNGERIYLTATNEEGEFIPYSGGPGFGGMMMGAYLTCAACHGADGRGGVHTMHMQVMDAPDIRYQALRGEAGEHQADADEGDEGHDGDHHHEGEAYTLEDFRRAVVEGEHPDGEPLSGDMPRWQMSDDDLADLFAHLKTLP
jgi:hypothetical protein